MKSKALYQEVYDKILEGIRTGEYPENSPLPAERFLCDKYHVSRSTLRAALNLLSNAELVYTIPGSGTFVTAKLFTQSLARFYSFTDTLKNDNAIIQNDIVNYELIPADEVLARKTGYQPHKLFHRLVRLRSCQDTPLMVETTYLPQDRFVNLDLNELSLHSLYGFLEKNYNFHPSYATETLRSVTPLPHERDLLQLYGHMPCMLLERFTFEGDRLSEYTRSTIRGDKFLFHVHLE